MQLRKNKVFIAGGAILLILLLLVFSSYNSLVKKDEKVKQHWAEVQNTYQRRLDLIPNLVNVVKGVSDFEQSTLEKITETRSKALSGITNSELTVENFQQQNKMQNELASATNRMIVQIEKYPVLKGTAAYAGLQTQLEGTERRIKIARNDFNEAVAIYNKKIRSFPTNLTAGIMGFKKKTGFEADAGSNKNVEIKF